MSALKELAEAIANGGIEKPPKGFLTVVQHAETSGMSRVHASYVLRRAVAAGKAEVQSFRIRTGSRVLPVPHYRIIQGRK